MQFFLFRQTKYTILFFLLLALTGCRDSDDETGKKYVTSIFVASDRHETGDGNALAALLRAIASDSAAVLPNTIFLGGDYVGSGPDRGEMGQPAFSVNDVRRDIDSVMYNHSCTKLLVYGSHDKGAKEGYAPFFSGPFCADGYYLYGISYAQMAYRNDSVGTYDGLDLADRHGHSAEKATADFDAWIATLHDHYPIIMMSHIPMHALRNDNQGGEMWYQSISKAAEEHDIILLFGHNHTMEGMTKHDRYHYLMVPGDSIITQGETVKNPFGTTIQSKTYRHKLNFYYGNAGYMKFGYGSLITLTSDWSGFYKTMEIRRYSVMDPIPAKMGETDKTNPYIIRLRNFN